METKLSELQMSRPLGPEDVRAGQYVCVMNILCEHMPLWCLFEESWKDPEPVRMLMMAPDAGRPLRVVEVCVPFILVEEVDRSLRTLDLRRYRLAAVSERYGEKTFKRLRRQAGSKA